MKKLFLMYGMLCLACNLIAQTTLNNTPSKAVSVSIRSMNDEQYPDNNSIGFRSTQVGIYTHNEIQFSPTENGKFDIQITPGNGKSDTILLSGIDLKEMIPSIPVYVQQNEYLTYLALLNQEWNRIQVKFNNQQFVTSGPGDEDKIISRVDIANNCLGKGDWEIIFFTKENDKEVLYFQCWFTFPDELYNHLFKMRNGIEITTFNNMLKNYGNRGGEYVDLSVLRTVNGSQEIPFQNLNNELYPLKGERQTKAKNIIYPVNYKNINSFLNDSTQFATFASPGMYTKTQPRATQLSKFKALTKVMYAQTISTNTSKTPTTEIKLLYNAEGKTVQYIIGGIIMDKIPVLSTDNLHNGYQRPMGIGNHSFYSAYNDILSNSSRENPYYGLLLDENGLWLDSHTIGTDGPLLFREEGNPNKLHILLLSFERHAFVGHYVIAIPQ